MLQVETVQSLGTAADVICCIMAAGGQTCTISSVLMHTQPTLKLKSRCALIAPFPFHRLRGQASSRHALGTRGTLHSPLRMPPAPEIPQKKLSFYFRVPVAPGCACACACTREKRGCPLHAADHALQIKAAAAQARQIKVAAA